MAEQGKDTETEQEKQPSEPVEKKGSWMRDMLYPLNHAVSCFFADSIIQPLVGAWVQLRIETNKLPQWLSRFFESHARQEAGHKHHFRDNLKHWFTGEIIGDVSAVPLTALVHHYVPWVANGVRRIAEPVAGRFFARSSRRDAQHWALDNHLDPFGPEAQAKQKEIYEYELGHLGDVFTWNVLSSVINVEAQKKLNNPAARSTLYTGKIFSTIVSNFLLLSARINAPGVFQRNEARIASITGKISGSHSPRASDDTTQGHVEKNWVGDYHSTSAGPAEISK